MRQTTFRAALLAAVLAFTATGIVGAQNMGNTNGQRITPNFKDAEIGQVIEAVAAATGKTIIPDPRVRAQVTMLSQTPMTPDAFYEAFLALLSVHQFVAVESGGIIKIVPDANARQMPNNDLPDRVKTGSDELITQVIAVENVNAAQLVPVLRPLHAAGGAHGGLPRRQHPHPLRSRSERRARHAHHQAHRPAGRQRGRHHQPADTPRPAKWCAW